MIMRRSRKRALTAAADAPDDGLPAAEGEVTAGEQEPTPLIEGAQPEAEPTPAGGGFSLFDAYLQQERRLAASAAPVPGPPGAPPTPGPVPDRADGSGAVGPVDHPMALDPTAHGTASRPVSTAGPNSGEDAAGTTGATAPRPATPTVSPESPQVAPIDATTQPEANDPRLSPGTEAEPAAHPAHSATEPTIDLDRPGDPATTPRYRPSFWDRYEEATAAADLLAIPSVISTAIVGRLDQAAPVARLHLRRQPADGRPIVVVSERPTADCVDDGWSVASSNEALRAVFRDALVPPALLIIDTNRALPMPLAETVDHLRHFGVELVRLVVDGSPDDEDLATWQGELGRPAALDLAGAIDPPRAHELLQRGEPIATIAGTPVTAELLLALELSTSA